MSQVLLRTNLQICEGNAREPPVLMSGAGPGFVLKQLVSESE